VQAPKLGHRRSQYNGHNYIVFGCGSRQIIAVAGGPTRSAKPSNQPLNLVKFLDQSAKLIFLKKVGGGYIFIHRMLLDYFADLTPQSAEDGKTGAVGPLRVLVEMGF